MLRLTLLLLLLLFAAPVAQSADKPNIVILFTDDQGTLDAGCYGSSDLHTPHIDSLARDGVRFTAAYAHTVCCPSRAALMTGRHPQRSGVNSWCQRNMTAEGTFMALEEITLAETLRDTGYKTALYGKWHLGAHKDVGPKCQGFDQFFGIRDGFIDNHTHFFLHGDGFHDLFEGTTEVFHSDAFFPDLIVNRSLSFLDDQAKNENKEPFFLYTAFNIPHYPEQAFERHLKMYEGVQEPRRSYGAFVTTTDEYIGKILKKLDQTGLREDTIVLFMSDNGHSAEDYKIKIDGHNSGYPKDHNYGANGGGGNTGRWIGHKGTFLEGGVRVPAIISWPGKLPSGAVRDQTITIMDWYPTLLEICNIEEPNVKFDGHSIVPIFVSPDAESQHDVLHFQWQQRWSVRDGDWKLIQHNNKVGDKPRFELLNLADEKPEQQDYSKEKPTIVERLRKLHAEFATDVSTGMPRS